LAETDAQPPLKGDMRNSACVAPTEAQFPMKDMHSAVISAGATDVQFPLKDVHNSASAATHAQFSPKENAPQQSVVNVEDAENTISKENRSTAMTLVHGNAVNVEDAENAIPKENWSSGMTLVQKQAALPPRKRRNEDVRKEFTFKEIVEEDSKKTESYCKHCRQRVQTAEIVNITKLAGHLISACKACPVDVREAAIESSQASKKRKLTATQADDGPKKSPEEPAIRVGSTSNHTSEAKILTLSASSAGPLAPLVKATQHGSEISRVDAMQIMRFDVEFALANFMAFDFFDDAWWKAAATSKEPGTAVLRASLVARGRIRLLQA
jgi:hypothetical protein